MQGAPATASHGAVFLSLVLAAIALLPAGAARADRDFAPFDCDPRPEELDALEAAHEALRPAVDAHFRATDARYQAAANALYTAERANPPLAPETIDPLVQEFQAASAAYQQVQRDVRAWRACAEYLEHLHRYLPRSEGHLRLALGYEGSLWLLPNAFMAAPYDYYEETRYRTPGASIQVGWERFYRRHLGLQVNGTLSMGQARMRGCGNFYALETCYGPPPVGMSLSVAGDVGIRVWIGEIMTIGASAELRLTRLPVTRRDRPRTSYGVENRVIPAALVRVSPEFMFGPTGSVSFVPSFGLGYALRPNGTVISASLRLVYRPAG